MFHIIFLIRYCNNASGRHLQRAGSKLSISVTREGHGQVEVSEAGGEVRSQQDVRGLDVAVSNWWLAAPNSRLV